MVPLVVSQKLKCMNCSIKSMIYKNQPLEAASTFKSRIFNWQLLQFQTLFIDCSSSFDVPYETFRKQLPKIKEAMLILGKRYGEQKNKLTEGFSSKVWKSLSQEVKIKHTYSKCTGCQNDPNFRWHVSFKKKWMH